MPLRHKKKNQQPSWMPRHRTRGNLHNDNHQPHFSESDLTNSDFDEEDYDQGVYLIRWQRETGVTDWNVMNVVGQVELLGQAAPNVMHQVKNEMIEGTLGIHAESGIFDTVYRYKQDAESLGVTECLRQQVTVARRGIRTVTGLTMTEYYELLKSGEIVESKNEKYPGALPGASPPNHNKRSSLGSNTTRTTASGDSYLSSPESAPLDDNKENPGKPSHVQTLTSTTTTDSSTKPKGCLIKWGMNSLYNERTSPDLHLCSEIMTDIHVWVERKNLEEGI